MRINAEKKEERERVALSLLRQTLSLAASHGFSSLGLREVSRAAGIAPTSFYRHFADMEELGRELIENLVGGLVRRLSTPEGSAEQMSVEALVNRTLAATVEDPELFRFIIAERVGAVLSFREALSRKLGVISLALQGVPAGEGTPRADDADSVVLMLLEACGDLLDHGQERLPALRARLARQARALLAISPGAKDRR